LFLSIKGECTMRIMKKILLAFLLLNLLSACSSSGERRANKTVELKFIKYNGDIELMKVNANTESIILSKMQVIRIEGLENLPNLTKVSLPFFSINSLNWIPKRIKELDLYGNELESIGGIEDFSNLELVDFTANHISNIDALFRNKKIKKAYLSGNKKIEIITCSDNDSIELLYLTDNNINHIYNLDKLSNLKYLSLQANPIENNTEKINELRKMNPRVEIKARR
jgi:Leucine-rich repeat (LRR) protein